MSKSSMPQFSHLSLHGQVASTFWAQTMLLLVSTLKWYQSPAEIAWTDAELSSAKNSFETQSSQDELRMKKGIRSGELT